MKHTLHMIVVLFACAGTIAASGQDSTGTATFIHAGTIEYERKENLRNEFTSEGDFADEIRKNMPENKITYFNLSFSGNKSLFQPGRDNPDNTKMWDGPGSNNIVYCDRNTGQEVSQKTIYGTTLLLSDSLHDPTWRITPDTRIIAGFDCHRATTVIMDSVFVVAFYSDEVIPSGGPESVGGLPGMIMGLVVPKLHTSWYATKLIVGEPKDIAQPKKGKKMTSAEMLGNLRDIFKDWGGNMNTLIMRVML